MTFIKRQICKKWKHQRLPRTGAVGGIDYKGVQGNFLGVKERFSVLIMAVVT